MRNVEYLQFGVHIKCKDLDQSLDFYQKLGFESVFAYGPDVFIKPFKHPTAVEIYRGVVFNLGESLFEIADGHVAVKPEVFSEKVLSSKVSAMICVDSVQKVIAVCGKEGFEIAVGLREYPWGTKEAVVKDPDGFVLVFIERLNH